MTGTTACRLATPSPPTAAKAPRGSQARQRLNHHKIFHKFEADDGTSLQCEVWQFRVAGIRRDQETNQGSTENTSDSCRFASDERSGCTPDRCINQISAIPLRR